MDARVFTVEQVLSPYMWVFYAAFAVAFCLTPIMQGVAARFGITDKPDHQRKLHRRAVPYLGGMAIFAGWAVGLIVSVVFCCLHTGRAAHPHLSYAIFAGALVIVGLGLVDDIRGLHPRIKVLGQLVAAGLLLFNGVGLHATRPAVLWLVAGGCKVLGIASPIVAGANPSWLTGLVTLTSAILCVLVILGSCNATNLMDGLDGLCGGVTAIIVAGFLFICVHIATTGVDTSLGGDAVRLILALAMLGAVLGFVPYNFNPASIFMGDTGSMFLGYCCGTLMLLMAEVQSKWFLAAMVIFALPVLDTALAFARRWIAGRPLFSADAKHFHHQLMQRGLSVRKTVLVSYALTITFALLGGAMVFMRTRFAVAFYVVIFASVVVAAYKMGMIHEKAVRRRKSRKTVPVECVSLPEFLALLHHAPDSEFRDLMTITWETGCRSRESFILEAGHVDPRNRCWVVPLPPDHGGGRNRIVPLNDAALALTERLIAQHPQGPLFRDPAGRPWSAQSCALRFQNLYQYLHKRYSLHALRISRPIAMAAEGLTPRGIPVGLDRPYTVDDAIAKKPDGISEVGAGVFTVPPRRRLVPRNMVVYEQPPGQACDGDAEQDPDQLPVAVGGRDQAT